MANGDTMLDAAGNNLLDSVGNVLLEDSESSDADACCKNFISCFPTGYAGGAICLPCYGTITVGWHMTNPPWTYTGTAACLTAFTALSNVSDFTLNYTFDEGGFLASGTYTDGSSGSYALVELSCLGGFGALPPLSYVLYITGYMPNGKEAFSAVYNFASIWGDRLYGGNGSFRGGLCSDCTNNNLNWYFVWNTSDGAYPESNENVCGICEPFGYEAGLNFMATGFATQYGLYGGFTYHFNDRCCSVADIHALNGIVCADMQINGGSEDCNCGGQCSESYEAPYCQSTSSSSSSSGGDCADDLPTTVTFNASSVSCSCFSPCLGGSPPTCSEPLVLTLSGTTYKTASYVGSPFFSPGCSNGTSIVSAQITQTGTDPCKWQLQVSCWCFLSAESAWVTCSTWTGTLTSPTPIGTYSPSSGSSGSYTIG
jgi:hypothetical protein